MQRVLNDSNSPTEQLRLIGPSADNWRYEFVGQQRLDLIQFRSVSVPDSHLFDGAALLRLSPRDFIQRIERAPGAGSASFVINAREASLSDSLATLLIRRGEPDRLNGFSFKVVTDPEDRRALASAIEASPPSRLRRKLATSKSAADGVADFLDDVSKGEGIDISDDLGLMRRGWQAWIDAAESGAITTEKWSGRFETTTAATRMVLGPEYFPNLYEVFEQVFERLVSKRAFSSDIDEYLAGVEAGLSATEITELARIRDWERTVRRKSLALRHRCSHRTTVGTSPVKESQWERLTASLDGGHQYPESFVERLGRVDHGDFQNSIAAARIDAWWKTGSYRDLRRVINRLCWLVEDAAPLQPDQKPGVSLLQVGFKIIPTGAAAAIGAHVGDALGAAVGTTGALVFEEVKDFVLKSIPHHRNVKQITEYLSRST